ncbi:non-ribosomal peptide synthetase [Marinomonas balearica]|uniref:Non-ribosomal peptide synthase protein (TIGR01720 family)/amino acid adenylation domain-containing protein n=1 Tax=Marinomonas balearica TaxID=491947 RepID=A0A4R6MCV8_9GAMM|nr:non-ribosomal peptide synthetase [Marinomonas balearica]TDO99501.1 non-ribosomal peptide synthase protein (TIGR01720 family)/amino acid adenylation domain-containing protein [Marinomonas balearica]
MALQDNVYNQEKSPTLPLTDIQLGIWLGDQIADHSNAFTIAHAVTITGHINVSQLAESINETLLKADTICAEYGESNEGNPIQTLSVELASVKTQVVSLVEHNNAEQAAQEEIMRDVNADLSLTAERPLCRQVLYIVSHETVIWYQRFHHIMLDGFSFNSFTKQVSNHYLWATKATNDSTGSVSIDAPFAPFSNVVLEESAYKESKKYQDDKAFWNDYASNISNVVSLSFEGVGSKAPASTRLTSEEHLTNAIQTQYADSAQCLLRKDSIISSRLLDKFMVSSRLKRVNPADVSLALVFAYLHKMTGARKIPVGFPFMGRIGSASLLALGPVVNVLPLQIDVDFDSSLDDVIANVTAELRKVRKHQKYNAEQIARDVGRAGEDFPLFAATLNLRLFNYDLSFGDATAQIEHLAAGPVEDLDFGMHFEEGNLHIEWVANSQRYNDATLARHTERFIEFVNQLAEAPNKRIAHQGVATQQELRRIHHWQQSPYSSIENKPLVFSDGGSTTDITEQFFLRPNAYSHYLALKTDLCEISHLQLTHLVCRWARAFQHYGLKQGDAVAMLLPRDERIVLAILALMQVRATVIPVDPEYPISRLEWIFEDSAPQAIITIASLSSRLPELTNSAIQYADKTIVLDDPNVIAQIESQSDEMWGALDGEVPQRSPLDLAYIMYTSGSTGRPKGVAIPYQGLTNLFQAHRVADYEPLLAQNRGTVCAAHTASFSFDSSWDMLLWIWMGQVLHIVNDELRTDAAEYVQYIQNEKIDSIDVPPSFLMQMLDADLCADEHVPKMIFIGGEAASAALWERVRRLSNIEVKNYYGPTENTVDSVSCSVRDSESVIIGRPIAGTRSYILDEGLNPVPEGVVGELYVSGAGLAHGYINRASQTASRFVANPFESHARMYRTGDLAKWTAEGHIEYLGRSDHQVQVRGYRVELEEVENVIGAVTDISASKVYAVEQGASNRLIAYCVCSNLDDSNEDLITNRVMAEISKKLPDYMLPSALKVVNAFPLNVNGKVDRSALPTLDTQQREEGKAPESLPEQLLCSAIANCLGMEQVFVDDDFFQLGGDSITAMSLGNLLRKEGFRVRPKEIFTAKTPEAIAKLMVRLDTHKTANQMVTSQRVSSNGELKDLPILHWFNEHVHAEGERGKQEEYEGQIAETLNLTYVQGVFVLLPPLVTQDHVNQALDIVVKRHPILTAAFNRGVLYLSDSIEQQNWFISIEENHDALQVSHNHCELNHKDLGRIADRAFHHIVQAISPQTSQLLKAAYIDGNINGSPNQRQSPNGLVLGIHHLAVDGVSWRILLQELKSICESLLSGEKGAIEEFNKEGEETSLRQWQSTLLDNIDVYRQQSAFWKQQLSPRQRTVLPTKSSRKALRHNRVLLGVEATKTLLEQLPQDYRANLDEILMAVTALAYARHFDKEDVRFALESHGRAELEDSKGITSDLSRTVGWLTSEFPLRIELSGSVFDRLKTLDLPYEQIVRVVRSQLQHAGECGIGYGVLRYLDPHMSEELKTLEQENRPDLLFNYLGRFREGQSFWSPQQTDGAFKDAFAVYQAETVSQDYPIELNIFVQEGEDGAQLALQWSWLPDYCSEQDIESITETVAAYAQCMHQYAKRNPETAANTATLMEISPLTVPEGAVVSLSEKYGVVDKVLPVLPLQEGLLFHAQMNELNSDSETEEQRDSSYSSLARLTLDGPLDLPRLQRSLDAVIHKHPQLAAIFDVNTLSQPVQVLTSITGRVFNQQAANIDTKGSSLWPLETVDLSHMQSGEQVARLQELECKELSREFNVFQSDGEPLLHAVLVVLATEKHMLFLNAHHLVVDGWSTPIMLNDLLSAYGSADQRLAQTTAPYHQIVSDMCARNKLEMKAAWQEMLAGVTPTLAFGENPPDDRVNTYRIHLNETKFSTLVLAYQSRGLTLNSVLQTVWANVLSAMTGKFDLVFGTPISGRFNSIEGVDEHIGLFSNTVPVRVTLSPKNTLWEQIQVVQNDQVQLLEHDGLGLSEIQRLVQPTNQVSGNLFDTLLVVENFPDQDHLGEKAFHGLRLTNVKNRGYTHYPLTILALPSNELELLFEYRGDKESIQAIMSRFEWLLGRLIDDTSSKSQEHSKLVTSTEPESEKTIAALNLQTPSEQSLIASINETAFDLPASTLRQELASQVVKTPNAICLMDEECALTYTQAREQVVALAHQLQLIGVQRGDIVAVALPRTVRLTIALWAIIEAGAAYLPLDTGYPTDRLNYMLDDAKPSALITLTSEAKRFDSQATVVLFERLIEIDQSIKALIEHQWSAPELSPSDAAYLLYTSGSTGKPKGVLVPHNAIVNRILWMQSMYPMDATDTVLQKTPCSFDVSVWEFFWSAMVGAKLMMAPPESHRDPQWLRQLINDFQITTVHFVPSMLAAFVSDCMGLPPVEQSSKDSEALCASLRQVFCSGEALSTSLSTAFETLFNRPLHNLYGPTEAAVDVTYHPAFGPHLSKVSGVSVPIGKPVWNTQLRVLDNYLRPVPVGVPGELYLCGVQLATGYWNRFDLTASRFVADPLGQGARMYRTGDVVRWLADGSVDYLGRSDDQLKIRGQRIELGEIERVLNALEGVDQCAVVAKIWGQSENIVGEDARQLIGYVVCDECGNLDVAAVRARLAEMLPIHMVPSVIMQLDALPLSANGKLDRKALPVPSESSSTEGREPRPGLETKLATTFAQILETDHIYADDDFFALGGHSLLAVKLVSELRRHWQLNVSIGQVMVSPSVEKLAHVLSDETLANNRELAGFGQILPIRQGKGTPIFCIHPASGFAWQYTGISRYLTNNCPIVGLQSPRPDGPIAAQADLEGMIDQHFELLLTQQATGPYRLMGYSLGGVIAHGLAVRLQRIGEEVSFLGLLDTYPPDDQDWSDPTDEEAQQEVEREKAQFMNDAAEHLDSEHHEIESTAAQEKDAMFEGIVANYADSIRHLSQATTHKFYGKAVLFVADRTVPEGMDIDATWMPFVDELEKHHFDYPHEDIMSPDALAELGPLVNQLVNQILNAHDA